MWPWRMRLTVGECVPDEVIHVGEGQRESVTLLVHDSGHVINQQVGNDGLVLSLPL